MVASLSISLKVQIVLTDYPGSAGHTGAKPCRKHYLDDIIDLKTIYYLHIRSYVSLPVYRGCKRRILLSILDLVTSSGRLSTGYYKRLSEMMLIEGRFNPLDWISVFLCLFIAMDM